MKAQQPDGTVDDYEMKIDEQVNKFLDLNHKLTFFLVTAAVGTLGFTLSFANAIETNGTPSPTWLVLLGLAGIAGLSSAWRGLRALHLDQQSFRLHLRYRYERKSWGQRSGMTGEKSTRAHRLPVDGPLTFLLPRWSVRQFSFSVFL